MVFNSGNKDRGMEKIIVMKFGGTSVGSINAISKVANIIQTNYTQKSNIIVVTSALSGITDLLLSSANPDISTSISENFLKEKTQIILNRHYEISNALIQDMTRRKKIMGKIEKLAIDFQNLCHAIHIIGEATPRALDAVASIGERMSIQLLSGILEEINIPSQPIEATELIITDENFQNAHPDMEISKKNIKQLLLPLVEGNFIPVITGFIGATKTGVITTLGRGGSDYTAAIIGSLLPASDVWIWTDVDGVMTSDPRIVPNAQTIPELSYREVAELAYFGAKVLHPKSIRPVIEAGIPLFVLNTFNPSHPGTKIVDDNTNNSKGKIKAVTTIQGLKLINIEGRGMLGVPGVAARTFDAVSSTGTSVPMITQASSEQSICFAVPENKAKKVIAALENVFADELARKDIDRIWAMDDVSIITVVGAGMRNTPGISAKVFTALGNQGINVIAIAQGSSEVSISIVVSSQETHQAVMALHDIIIKD